MCTSCVDHFSALQEKYSALLQERISPLKEILLELEAAEPQQLQRSPHPKLAQLVRVVSRWKKEMRRSSRDKVRRAWKLDILPLEPSESLSLAVN